MSIIEFNKIIITGSLACFINMIVLSLFIIPRMIENRILSNFIRILTYISCLLLFIGAFTVVIFKSSIFDKYDNIEIIAYDELNTVQLYSILSDKECPDSLKPDIEGHYYTMIVEDSDIDYPYYTIDKRTKCNVYDTYFTVYVNTKEE